MRDAARSITTRDALLDATDRLLARYGYRKMTIDDLAHEVGIGKGSVYLHFASKEDLVLSHIDRIIERLKDRLTSIAGEVAGVETRLSQMLIERVTYRFDSVQHYTQNLNDMLGHIRPKLLERRERYFDEEARIFATVIAEGQAASVFIAGDALDRAQTLLNATNSLLPYSLSSSELGDRSRIEDRARKIAEVLIKGLAK